MQAHDHTAGAKRGARHVAAAAQWLCHRPVSGDPYPRSLLHDEPAHDESGLETCAAEEEFCKPRDDSARGGEAEDPRGSAGREDAHAAEVQCEC